MPPLFYFIAFMALLIGLVISDRRWYARAKHPAATHSKGMMLIGVTGGMGVSSIFFALS